MINKIDLSKYSNDAYNPGESKWKICLWYLVNRIFFNTYFLWPMSLKKFILILFGAKIGKGMVIKPKVNIKYPWFLEMEDYVWIGQEVWIDNLALVKIGSNVCISQAAMLLTGSHNYKLSNFDLMLAEIHIEDGVWIGAKSVVCPGVTCKMNSILTVNSVANKDLEKDMIYQGNPAVKKRKRELIQ